MRRVLALIAASTLVRMLRRETRASFTPLWTAGAATVRAAGQCGECPPRAWLRFCSAFHYVTGDGDRPARFHPTVPASDRENLVMLSSRDVLAVLAQLRQGVQGLGGAARFVRDPKVNEALGALQKELGSIIATVEDQARGVGVIPAPSILPRPGTQFLARGSS